MAKDKIQFKALHEGMGFHPFSDGLPYAPESKTPIKSSTPKTTSQPMGTGAVAAGRPHFVTARQLKQMQEKAPRSTVSLQAAAPMMISTRISGEPERVAASATLTAPRIAPQAAPATSPRVESSVDLTATLLRRRFFAYGLDTAIHTGFWLATNLSALFFFKFQIDAELVQEHLAQFLIFFAISQWLFIALQEMLFETTIGKSFFNLEFKRNHGSLFLRSIVFGMGALAFGLGIYFRLQDRLGQLQLKSKLYS